MKQIADTVDYKRDLNRKAELNLYITNKSLITLYRYDTDKQPTGTACKKNISQA